MDHNDHTEEAPSPAAPNDSGQLTVADGGAGLSRRQFLGGLGTVGIGALFGGAGIKALLLPDEVLAFPASQGYLLVDTKRCSGCTTCMLACSLTHHGRTSQSLGRLQVTSNPYGHFPDDITISQCRQCPFPSCVEACPTGANHVDAKTGVRMIDYSKCIGCERCVNACPFTPSRAVWNFEDKHAQKCDLCLNTPFWDHEGGPEGMRACETVCPMRAITFTDQIPAQNGDGYIVDLRTGTPWDPRFNGAVGATGVPGSGKTSAPAAAATSTTAPAKK
jgi:protein NrfC